MAYTVDARGQSCPIPVVMTKKAAAANPSGFDVLVDSSCSVENITRFAANNGFSASVHSESQNEYRLSLVKLA